MNKSESIKELATALSKAQYQFDGAAKNAKNPHFKSDFANLQSIWEAISEPLHDNGLRVIQSSDVIDGQMILETTLAHSSGEWISGRYPLNPTKNDPQGLGGAVTYARRYALAAIFGVYQVDDDANDASSKPKPPKHNPPTKQQMTPQASPKMTPLDPIDSMDRGQLASAILAEGKKVGWEMKEIEDASHFLFKKKPAALAPDEMKELYFYVKEHGNEHG